MKNRDIPKNRPQLNLKPVVTNFAGLKHFYDGDVPPWDESLGEFQVKAYSDRVRLAAYELERDANALRIEANEIDEREAA